MELIRIQDPWADSGVPTQPRTKPALHDLIEIVVEVDQALHGHATWLATRPAHERSVTARLAQHRVRSDARLRAHAT
jgi:hypothetical protein